MILESHMPFTPISSLKANKYIIGKFMSQLLIITQYTAFFCLPNARMPPIKKYLYTSGKMLIVNSQIVSRHII